MSELTNIASEEAVLSGLIQHGQECFVEVDQLIDENVFTNDGNKVIYKCVTHSLKENEKIGIADILSAAQTLNLREYIEQKEGSSKIKQLKDTLIDINNVIPHAKRIARLSFARKMQNQLRDIYRGLNEVTGEESIASILSVAEEPIQKLCLSYIKEDDMSPVGIGDGIKEYIEHLKNKKGESIGIPTGFPEFDKAIGGGLRRKCVDLISARPKVGKSVVADNVALHIAGQYNIPVLMLDTEMSKEDHHHRLLANLANVEINEIASGSFADDPEKCDRIDKAGDYLENIPYKYISISGRPFEETLSIAKRWLLKEVGYDENGRLNDCVIINDYLKLMSSTSIKDNLAEFQVLGFQITALHNFCVENDCPCLSFVQLNRDGITRESTDVVSGSDRLVWLCTSFSIFKEKTEDEKVSDGRENGNRKLIPIVSRHGPGIQDEGYICLNMEGEYARLTEIGTIRQIKKNSNNDGFEDEEGFEDEDDQEDSRPF